MLSKNSSRLTHNFGDMGVPVPYNIIGLDADRTVTTIRIPSAWRDNEEKQSQFIKSLLQNR